MRRMTEQSAKFELDPTETARAAADAVRFTVYRILKKEEGSVTSDDRLLLRALVPFLEARMALVSSMVADLEIKLSDLGESTPTRQALAVCLNCGHATDHTEEEQGSTALHQTTRVCGWQRDATDSQPIFRCICMVLDLGDGPSEDELLAMRNGVELEAVDDDSF